MQTKRYGESRAAALAKVEPVLLNQAPQTIASIEDLAWTDKLVCAVATRCAIQLRRHALCTV
ncbi:MAG: hypothetical protein ABIS45_09780 [Burkholderiales bacterium]